MQSLWKQSQNTKTGTFKMQLQQLENTVHNITVSW